MSCRLGNTLKNWSYGTKLLNWWPKGLKNVLLRHLGQEINYLSKTLCLPWLFKLWQELLQFSMSSVFNSPSQQTLLSGGFFIKVGEINLKFVLLVSSLDIISSSKNIWRLSKELPIWLFGMSRSPAVSVSPWVLVTWPSAFIPSWVYGWSSRSSISGPTSNNNNSVFRLGSDSCQAICRVLI